MYPIVYLKQSEHPSKRVQMTDKPPDDRIMSAHDRLELKCVHYQTMTELRLKLLEERMKDHETRIRCATEGVTQFRYLSGLSSGGSIIFSLAALLRTFFGV